MVVLVARERQAVTLDRVGDEDGRPVVVDRLEGLEQARQVVAAEIAHEPGELLVRAALDEGRDRPLVAEIVEEALPPRGPALEGERRVELVRAGLDPLLQALAAGLGESGLLQLAVAQHHHVPAEVAEDGLEAGIEALADHRIEALAVVVDDPPGVAKPMLPAFQQGLEDVALVHLGVAHKRHHAALRLVLGPAAGLHVVLHQGGEEGLRDAEAHRARGEVHVVDVLGAGGIGLGTL
jgi:hypothetical protein